MTHPLHRLVPRVVPRKQDAGAPPLALWYDSLLFVFMEPLYILCIVGVSVDCTVVIEAARLVFCTLHG